jgi:hypothetical protein
MGTAKEITTLARLLGMLGSTHDNEVLVAARKAEALRRKLGLTWTALLVRPRR